MNTIIFSQILHIYVNGNIFFTNQNIGIIHKIFYNSQALKMSLCLLYHNFF